MITPIPMGNYAGVVYYDITPPNETLDADSDNDLIYDPISNHESPTVAVIGVGYVGEHLVMAFAQKFRVIGYDVSVSRIAALKQRVSSTRNVLFTCRAQDIATAKHFLISVPTLLNPDKTIDASYLKVALNTVGRYARPGSTVVIESSVAVGMTRELLGPLCVRKGFFAGMSPERVDPGRTEPPPCDIPKIISGLDDLAPGSLQAIRQLYSQVFNQLVSVSRPEVAEMTKLYENCQRMIGIAYANEMADACIGHNINPFEVCNAAATKPFGYMPFTPSIGVGGHCIPINPYYLLSNNQFPMLQAATVRMSNRPSLIAERIVSQLRSHNVNGVQPRVLIVGMGFKRGQGQLSHSPGLELGKSLVLSNAVRVTWIDPLVKQEQIPQIERLDSCYWSCEYLEESFDFIVVSVRQKGLDFEILKQIQGVQVQYWC